MGLKEWADLATIVSSVGVLTAVVALFFAWKQFKHSADNLKHSADNSRAQLWMDLRKMFDGHMDVHSKLRKGDKFAMPQPRPGCCKQNASWPCCEEEWVKVESYIGLFEHCEDLLEEGLIDKSTFQDIYRYRVKNITDNEKIKSTKLVKLGKHWLRFRALAKRFDIDLPPVNEEQKNRED